MKLNFRNFHSKSDRPASKLIAVHIPAPGSAGAGKQISYGGIRPGFCRCICSECRRRNLCSGTAPDDELPTIKQEPQNTNISVSEYRIIGGGAKGKLWRQILADILAMPLTITLDNDSSLGSAMLAGVATGMFADFKDSVDKCVVVSAEVTPIPENVEIYEQGFKSYRAIQKAMAEVYHQIN